MTDTTDTTTEKPTPRPQLPRNYADYEPEDDEEPFQDDDEPYYIFRGRFYLPVSRSVALLLLVDPYESMVQFEDSKIVSILFYLLYLPLGVTLFLVAELAFVFWFDLCCQQLMVPQEQIGIYGKGKLFALPQPESEKMDSHDEYAQGQRQRRPTTTCLPIYNMCLETSDVEDEDEDEGADNGAPVFLQSLTEP